MTKQVDIFDVLKNIDKNIDKNGLKFFNQLTQQEKGSVHPLVVMRWMSGCNSKDQILLLNSLVNPFVYKLHKHSDLLIKNLMVCSTGEKRYQWLKRSGKVPKFPKTTNILCDHFNASIEEVQNYLKMTKTESIIECIDDLGLQSDEMKEIKKELSTHANI
jgi:hypothetical protein